MLQLYAEAEVEKRHSVKLKRGNSMRMLHAHETCHSEVSFVEIVPNFVHDRYGSPRKRNTYRISTTRSHKSPSSILPHHILTFLYNYA